MALAQEQIQYLITYVHDKSGAQAVITGNKNIAGSFSRLAGRAALVIPVWLALRAAYMSFIRTIQMGVQHIVDFDKAMARVLAVTHGVADTKRFIFDLKDEIQGLAIETGTAVEKIAEAFYRFGTAGHDATIATEGMKIALKTSIAIMGDVEQTA
ncbi:hypothetical protein LCGC14_2739900, partial [marine sediment metagenome]